MRNLIALICAGALTLGACATTTQQSAQAPDATASSAPAETEALKTAEETDLQEVVCRKVQVTGSRFGEKVCKTRAEWAEGGALNDTPSANNFKRALHQNIEGG